MIIPSPINEKDGGLCWCPMCKSTAERAALCGIWVYRTPQHVPVCHYLFCVKCSIRFKKMSEKTLVNVSVAIENNLLEHYPELRQKLPPDYKSRQTDGEGFSA